MKITRFDMTRLFNEEWSSYENFLIKVIKQDDNRQQFAPLLPRLEANAASAGQAMEIIAKSAFTRRCDELDEKRDRLIGSVNSYVRSFLYDEEAVVSEAALDLMIVIDHYAGMAKENRDQQSSRIINFVDEMTVNNAEKVAKLEGLARRLKQLSAANEEYIKLQDERTFSEAGQTDLRMINVRKEGDAIIRTVWGLIDVLLFTAPTPEIEHFASLLNAENLRVRDKLAARKGKKESEEKKKKEENKSN